MTPQIDLEDAIHAAGGPAPQKRRPVQVARVADPEKGDWYPTPAWATQILMDVEPFVGAIWEPACGDGAMSKVMMAAGHTVYSTDLFDRGYGENGGLVTMLS
jgi:hypothetical protein